MKNLKRVQLVYLLGKPEGVVLRSYSGYQLDGNHEQYTDYYTIRLENGLLLRDVLEEEFIYI